MCALQVSELKCNTSLSPIAHYILSHVYRSLGWTDTSQYHLVKLWALLHVSMDAIDHSNYLPCACLFSYAKTKLLLCEWETSLVLFQFLWKHLQSISLQPRAHSLSVVGCYIVSLLLRVDKDCANQFMQELTRVS
jgi:hypothetical protein